MYCINSFGHKTGTVATVELFSYLRSPQVICEAPFQIVISRFQRERLYIETIFASLSSNFNKNQIFFSYLFSLLTDLVRLCHRFSFFSSPPSQILFGSTIVSISFNEIDTMYHVIIIVGNYTFIQKEDNVSRLYCSCLRYKSIAYHSKM